MYCQSRSPQRSKAFLFLTALLGCLVASSSFSQEVSTQEASFTNDESGRVVGLTYFGRAGLRQSVPQDLSSLTSVEISYGAILTQEDIEFLSSLHNVKELSFGGNLDDEYVIIEGSLSPLASLKRLEHLFLCKRDMCDSDLGFIGELPNLQYLEFLAGPIQSTNRGLVLPMRAQSRYGERSRFAGFESTMETSPIVSSMQSLKT